MLIVGAPLAAKNVCMKQEKDAAESAEALPGAAVACAPLTDDISLTMMRNRGPWRLFACVRFDGTKIPVPVADREREFGNLADGVVFFRAKYGGLK